MPPVHIPTRINDTSYCDNDVKNIIWQAEAARRRPPLENPKEAVKLRLDHDVLAAYRKTGSGWQTRINADLRKAARKLAG
jgi:uncharacterized protein (DUF4415 family)